jgi:hypothetical protein
MSVSVAPVDRSKREEEYWSWAGGALFVLLSIVPMTAMAAASDASTYGGLGPAMEWALGYGLEMFLGLHLLTAVLALLLFHGLILTIERAEPPYDQLFALTFEVWVGLLLSVGLFLFANNMTFLLYGTSLL